MSIGTGHHSQCSRDASQHSQPSVIKVVQGHEDRCRSGGDGFTDRAPLREISPCGNAVPVNESNNRGLGAEHLSNAGRRSTGSKKPRRRKDLTQKEYPSFDHEGISLPSAENSLALNGPISISEERLIAESGQPLPMPKMQGFPVPPPGLLSSGVVGLDPAGPTDAYAMSSQERSNYENWFSRYDADQDGFITGQEARDFFFTSGLARENLRQIWDLADADNDANLSLAEFCVAMHLVVCASKKGLAIPATLPRSLVIAGTGSSLPAGADAASGGSSSTPGLQTPGVRSSPTVQSSTVPAGSISAPMAAMNLTDRDDAFSVLPKEVPVKGPTSSKADSETEGVKPIPPLELLSSFAESSASNAQPQPQPQPQTKSQDGSTRRSLDLTANSSARDDSADGTWMGSIESQADAQELAVASNALLDAVQSASTSHTQALKVQTSTLKSVSALVRELNGQRESLTATLEANKAEHLENERQLQEINLELEDLQKELSSLRNQFQAQNEKTEKLRTLVAQAAGQRGILLAEIKACKTATTTQQVESKYLESEAAMSSGTLEALDTLKANLQRDETQDHSVPQQQAIIVETEPSMAEHKTASMSHRKPESKSEVSSEPIMPVETPPLPPELMSASRVVEDPFAEMLSKESAEKDGASQPKEAEAVAVAVSVAVSDLSSQTTNSGNEVKSQGLFDAFQTVGDAFDTDPFSVTSFSGTAVEETVDDPFAATDAVFSSATAAASEVFDAFNSSTEDAGFSAFAPQSQ